MQAAFDYALSMLRSQTLDSLSFSQENIQSRKERTWSIINNLPAELQDTDRDRLFLEFEGLGPLESLINDSSITEILVNGPDHIWIERGGELRPHPDRFFSSLTYRNAVDRLLLESQHQLTLEHPSLDGSFRGLRLSIIGDVLTKSSAHISLRRHPENAWTFQRLQDFNWASLSQIEMLKWLFQSQSSFLVVGPTSSGKTSILNAFMQEARECERIITIEDTSELVLPNTASMRLVTRVDFNGVLPEVTQTDLLKRSLRLRPDRIVLGEIRGSEAKDFLMALATGHQGCFGSIHALDAQQALLRLEMLIQMGAPQWSLQAIRRLIFLSLKYIVVAQRSSIGRRHFGGLYRISSLEESGFLLEPVELLTP